MSSDKRESPRWTTEPETGKRIARIAAAITDLISSDPDGGDDLHGIVVMHDGAGASGAGIVGYGDEPGVKAMSDFIRFAGLLFASAGVKMDVLFRSRTGNEHVMSYKSPLEESEPGEPEATLVISGIDADEQMKRACEIVTSALEQDDLLSSSRTVIILGRDEEESVLMHHGYGEGHDVIRTLLSALQAAMSSEGGQLIVLPAAGHPN